jgi:uncharacterized protein YuzE
LVRGREPVPSPLPRGKVRMGVKGLGRNHLEILYNSRTDLLYLRLDDRKQEIINKRVSEDIVLDIGENDRIIGIEILDASRNLNLDPLLPVTY